MLQISKASDYALLFLSHLIRQPDGRWSVREAAEALNIPQRFLANIVHQLSRNNLVVTQKGTYGGVRLKKDPTCITLLDIIQIFDGPLTFMPCRKDASLCQGINNCSFESLLEEVRQDIISLLQGKTLKDLGGLS